MYMFFSVFLLSTMVALDGMFATLYTGTTAPAKAGSTIKSGKYARSDGSDLDTVEFCGVQVPLQKFSSESVVAKSTEFTNYFMMSSRIYIRSSSKSVRRPFLPNGSRRALSGFGVRHESNPQPFNVVHESLHLYSSTVSCDVNPDAVGIVCAVSNVDRVAKLPLSSCCEFLEVQ
jgi:hypothetical protein